MFAPRVTSTSCAGSWGSATDPHRRIECSLVPGPRCPVAGVVELADTQDLGSCAARREGSSPFSGTSTISPVTR